jgi:hypothetical protein
MKIHAVYDSTGKILAAVQIGEDEGPIFSNAKSVGRLRPVPQAGQYAADLDVPTDYAKLGFVGVCEKLKVEHGPAPKLKPEP